jgi:putative ABC transport system permease protein
MALGASRRSVARSVLTQGFLMVAVGSLIGLPTARVGTQLLQHTLYGVQRHDVPSFIAAAAILLLIATIACLVPVRRAITVDPVIAMRAE